MSRSNSPTRARVEHQAAALQHDRERVGGPDGRDDDHLPVRHDRGNQGEDAGAEVLECRGDSCHGRTLGQGAGVSGSAGELIEFLSLAAENRSASLGRNLFTRAIWTALGSGTPRSSRAIRWAAAR